MSTLNDILQDIDLRIPNSFSVDFKVNILNEILMQLYKYMNKEEKEIYQFDTVADLPLYAMSSDMTIDEIISVTIANDLVVTQDTTFKTYTLKGYNEELNGYNYFDALNGLIGLYPVPEVSGYKVNVLYEKKPPLLSASDLTASPTIDERYYDILKFYTCIQIADSGNNPDIEQSNNFRTKFNDAWKVFYKDYIESKIKTPKKSRSNRWWR